MSTALPWDRFTPIEEPDNVLQPPPPAPPVSAPQPPSPPTPAAPPPSGMTPTEAPLDFASIVRDSVSQVMAEALPAIKDQAIEYAYATAAAAAAGQKVDHANPTITATTRQGRELVVADAKSRSIRTLIQGLGIDITFALVATLASLTGADPFQKETWILFGSLLIKTLIQTVVSYVMRLKVTPTMKTEGETLAIMPVPRPMIEEK